MRTGKTNFTILPEAGPPTNRARTDKKLTSTDTYTPQGLTDMEG